jgi:aminoglycoside/choline kinase family phosphotransferase
MLNDNARQNLEQFLRARREPSRIEPLTPDASTREYFRIGWANKTAIACVYPEPFLPEEQTYLDVTNLFLISSLPVAKIYDFDGALGVIVLEDFGDTILRDVLEQASLKKKDELINDAIKLIARIQVATAKAFELNSIASRLKFDEEKLLWELNFFREHYFETLKKQMLSREENQSLTEEFTRLARELERRAAVLCHRDFHAANLMIDGENRLRIIDQQDARIGAASYDLVSLLLDRVLETPGEERLAAKIRFLLDEREKLGLASIGYEDFLEEFRLQTVQRCLKAVGTFSFQSVKRGKIHFIPFIQPMFRIVLDAAKNLRRFPNLQKILKEQIL